MKPKFWEGTLVTRIASIEVTTATLPLRSATAFSGRTVIARSYCLVRVTGDDGVSGIGFCYAGNVGGGLPAAAVRDLFAPIILGRDAHSTEALWATMYQEGLLHGRTGSVMRALSACDIALWDRNSRAAGLPLWKYLGAYADTTVKAYASGGYYLKGKGPQELADEMRSYVEAGFHAVKMKIGRLSIEADEERLAAARDAVGPHVEIMLDCNNGFADLTVALRSMKRWEKYDPYWIEEPFGPDDIESHARLAERTPVLVATGEIEAGRWRHHELLSKKAAVILQTDAAVCGGVSEYRRIAATAATFGVQMCPHWFHDLHAHLVASTPNADYVEYFPDDAVLNFRLLIDQQVELDAGRIVLSRKPGLGFDLDDETVIEHSDGWQRLDVTA